MTWLQYDLLRIKLFSTINQLKYNKMITLISFIFLIMSIFFIQIHPKSVWYYFASGFFMNEMTRLIVEKTYLKRTIEELIKTIDQIRRDFL